MLKPGINFFGIYHAVKLYERKIHTTLGLFERKTLAGDIGVDVIVMAIFDELLQRSVTQFDPENFFNVTRDFLTVFIICALPLHPTLFSRLWFCRVALWDLNRNNGSGHSFSFEQTQQLWDKFRVLDDSCA